MIDVGFSLTDMGGGCRALVRHVNGCTIVATAEDGDLPSEDDFLVCVYDSAKLDPEAQELAAFATADVGDAPASGLSPIDEALSLADWTAGKLARDGHPLES
ncbi:MAG TPA: hypothetical protein VFW19_10465 [Allosphingosinicella sp.]|nr:hypothetical protein [Allosphingosinicella sp.]